MAKFKKDSEDFKFTIDEFIGSVKESDKHDWCKAVARISWNEQPSTLDIRSLNLQTNRVGRGISLSDEETDKLVDILLESDYGSLEVLQSALKRKMQRFSISQEADECFSDGNGGKLVIKINC